MLYPLIFGLQMPLLLFIAVSEKASGMKRFLHLSGLDPPRYYLLTALFNVCVSALVGGCLAAAGALTDVRFFAETSAHLIAALVMLTHDAN